MANESAQTHAPAAAPSPSAIWGWLLSAGYVALGVWAAVAEAWVDGNGLWREGAWSLPEPAMRSLSLVLVIGWLLYGLSWPVRTVRMYAWIGLGLLQFPALLLLSPWWGPAFVMTALHVFAFDPRWLKPVRPAEPELLFYDGYCGLCHRWVKLVMRADADGALFAFAPLQGPTAERILTPAQRDTLPDSVVVRTTGGQLLVKSDAVAYILKALGGWHGLAGLGLRLVPGPLRNFGYDCVARVRHRLFARPSEACPMMPPELRGRFMP